MTGQERLDLLRKGFNDDQIDEIEIGEKGLIDTSCYMDTRLSALHMKQIRLALEEGLDIEIYARPDFDWLQLEEIRRGLEKGLNIRIYAYPLVSYDVMREIRRGLEDGINLGRYASLNAGIIREIRKSFKSGVSIMSYVEHNYDAEQLEQIRIALEERLKIQPYLDPSFRGISIAEIRIGLEHRIDVSQYAKLEYNWRQMREIRLGLEKQLDVSMYINPLYDYQQMREIRRGLEMGINVSYYNSLMYTATAMADRRQYFISHLDDIYADGKAPVIINFDNFTISIDNDEMKAYLRMNDEQSRIDSESIIRLLRGYEIVDGINFDEIDELVAGNRTNQTVLIAKGRKPTKGRDGWYEYFFRTDLTREPKVLEDGSLDYKDITWFEQVVKEQRLALYHDAEDGMDGYTVTGKVLPGIKGKQCSILRGNGFYINSDKVTYTASVNGIITLDDDIMNIDRLLEIDEATAATGNIVFDGSVRVRGNVGSGASINASEDIFVDGFVEGAELEAGRNITISKGVNADGRGSITAGGQIFVKYIENANVKCIGSLNANYILNSQVYCEDNIVISGRKGSIIGGLTYATKKIQVTQIGNMAGVKTLIKLGISDNIVRNRVRCENKLKEIDNNLLSLHHLLEDLENKMPPEERNINEVYIKAEKAVFSQGEQRKIAMAQKEKWDHKVAMTGVAKAIVSGSCYTNVIVEINGKRWNSPGTSHVTIKAGDNEITADNRGY